jgi:molybdopterin converting factor small subunit
VRIKIILHSSLRKLLPEETKGRAILDLPEGSKIRSIMEILAISTSVICAVNDQIEPDIEIPLTDGDVLRFLHPSAGG